MKYYTVYKTTNLVNGKIYIGCHQTEDLDDDYIGSGKYLGNAIKKYGRDHFKREWIGVYENASDMFEMEAKLVNEEFLKRTDVYNLKKGGEGGWANYEGTFFAKDDSGKTLRITRDDPRYMSGELVHVSKDTVTVKDKDGNTCRVSVNDPKYLNGELVGIAKGFVNVKDSDGRMMQVRIDDSRYLSGELVPVAKWMITVKDVNGKIYRVLKSDHRYLSGKFKTFPIISFSGKKHNDNSKEKMRIRALDRLKKNPHPSIGTCWICKEKESKKIWKKDLELFLKEGWIKGRVQGPNQKIKDRLKDKTRCPLYNKTLMYNDQLKCTKFIKNELVEKYLLDGWIRGRGLC